MTEKIIKLPDPQPPIFSRMVTNPILDNSGPVFWSVGGSHPLEPEGGLRIVRMFIVPGGVEVYSVSGDTAAGVRNFMPMALVRITEEAMPIDVFVEELRDAEAGDDDEDENEDDDDEPLDEPDNQRPAPGLAPPLPPSPPASPNGQTSS